MINKPLITVIGANPAWQKTLFFREFIPGRVNRAYKEENYSSGKGVNFSAHCAVLNWVKVYFFNSPEESTASVTVTVLMPPDSGIRV